MKLCALGRRIKIPFLFLNDILTLLMSSSTETKVIELCQNRHDTQYYSFNHRTPHPH